NDAKLATPKFVTLFPELDGDQPIILGVSGVCVVPPPFSTPLPLPLGASVPAARLSASPLLLAPAIGTLVALVEGGMLAGESPPPPPPPLAGSVGFDGPARLPPSDVSVDGSRMLRSTPSLILVEAKNVSRAPGVTRSSICSIVIGQPTKRGAPG